MLKKRFAKGFLKNALFIIMEKSIKNKIKNGLRVALIGITTFLTIKSVTLFYRGYHNLDIAFNFLNLGFKQDITLNGSLTSLSNAYLIGRNQMLSGFGWLLLDLILMFYLGYLMGVKNE